MRSLIVLTTLACLIGYSDATRHEVKVGSGGLKFEPETVDAVPGDTVTYSFFPRNHTVTQSAFDRPCQFLEGGFFSGFVPTDDDNAPALTTYTIPINDTKPIWLYCGQSNGNHCQNGMVHAINAPKEGERTFDAYRRRAETAGTSSNPPKGEPVGGVRLLKVQVGEQRLKFTPEDIREPPGTLIEFSFFPMAHTVTQSSFDKPCQPLDDGFSSGFIPTNSTPSGATFQYTVDRTSPVWFYCAQTNGNHCQSGMVGSINAPKEGERTLESFKKLAEDAPESKIQDKAPLGGLLFVNGTLITELDGNRLELSEWDDESLDNIPETGKMDPYMKYQAGGSAIENYGWGESIDDETVKLVQLLQWLDNILLSALMRGIKKLEGDWSGAYPDAILHTLKAMTAQTYVHRTTATDTLQHYKKDTMKVCEYEFEMNNVDEFLNTVVTGVLLEIALLVNVLATVAQKDPWLVPNLATSLGSKSRMSGVLNMMQSHMAAAAPREVSLPPGLVYSYAHTKWVKSCPSDIKGYGDLPALEISETKKNEASGKTTSIKVKSAGDKSGGWAAFIGAWGKVWTQKVAGDGKVEVPADLHGHVWVVLTSEDEKDGQDLYNVTTAGPAMVWLD